jgi:pyruvate dehydrogenase E2 component (dihydrolipoamide acetyltransferase)
VSAGDVVAEIETDKATFEVTAPVDGAILATFFDEGALVPVFTNLFVIGNQGENADTYRPGAAPIEKQPAPPASETPAAPEAISPRASAAGAFSPRARRFADEHDFHPPSIAGSGPGGRVLEEDVRREYYSTSRIPAKKEPETPAARLPGIREKIARRMRESLASTAQYTLNSSADAAGLLNLRARIKASKGIVDININDLVVYCAIQALLQLPGVNVEFIDGKIHKHTAVHIGFACDTPRGLMVPVVRDADKLSISELALKMKELTAQAVQGSISPDDLSGATFTVSNLGNLGIETFTPLLNPPQVAILGVGAIQVKPVRKQGKLEFIDAISLSLTCDHQIIDGAPGARFLQVVREKIENVERLCTI